MQSDDNQRPPGRGLLPRDDDKPFDPRPRPRPVPATVDEAIEERMASARDTPSVNPLEQFAKGEPYEPRTNDPEEIKAALVTRASEVIDTASMAIVDNITTLIQRAERLKQSLLADTEQSKARITANLNHGARILELSKRMNSELDELENVHRQQLKG